MPNWDAELYLRFERERAQPAIDLLARLELKNPQRIADLGCGPGNITALLRRKWRDAHIEGIDNSPPMLQAAARNFPDEQWTLGDIANWRSDKPYDLVFSNAALQWLPHHAHLMPRLLAQVESGGALAVQIPSGGNAPLRRVVREVAQEPQWESRCEAPSRVLTIEPPAFYYDILQPHAARLEIWETEYSHIMKNVEAIVEWYRGTGLRSFLEALENERQREEFLAQVRAGYAREYSQRIDKRILLPFRRLFFIAYR
jgi:trans-aconitate 2-methyltransferase